MGQGEGSELRYDAAIIGAGAEGLAAATILGRAGLRVAVIERGERAGGRLLSREFHPGFRVSPFVDDVAEIPASLFWQLDLARRGALAAPPRLSLAAWPDRRHRLALSGNDTLPLLAVAAGRRREIAARALAAEEAAPSPSLFHRRETACWPAEDWAVASLDTVVNELPPDVRDHVAALALARTAADPLLPGSALHLLGAGAGSDGVRIAGGTDRLAAALVAAASAAGVAFRFGLEVSDIHRRDGKVVAVGLADGSEIAAASVVSTLDLKRTFLTFFAWNALPKTVVARVNAFRMAASTARVLFALDRRIAGVEGPVHVAPSLRGMSEAFQAWRAGAVCEHLPITLNVVSAREPGLAPQSRSVVTATLGAVPARLFDGTWTHEKRELLRRRALDAAESVWPGFGASVVAGEVVVPSDIEDALGATDGDLAGGEVAGDQMLGAGPWIDCALPRTPIQGLYLAGSHLTAGAFATCAAGAAAANALLADRARGGRK